MNRSRKFAPLLVGLCFGCSAAPEAEQPATETKEAITSICSSVDCMVNDPGLAFDTSERCRNDWLVALRAGAACPRPLDSGWDYSAAMPYGVEELSGVCEYAWHGRGAPTGTPVTLGVSTPLRADCSEVRRRSVPGTRALKPEVMKVVAAADEDPIVVYGGSGGRPVYYNPLSRTAWSVGAVRVRLRALSAVQAEALGSLAIPVSDYVYTLPEGGFYELTAGPADVSTVEYQQTEEVQWHPVASL